jgi:hypothetical protein
MRYRYYTVIQDLQGNVVSGAQVSVYLAGTTVGATVYSYNTSSNGTNIVPQVTSGTDGTVLFWLDSNDYASGQLFDIFIVSGSLGVSLSNVQIIVWDAVNATNAVNATSAQNATKLSTARNISTSGDATGVASFDGSADITIPLTLANTGVNNGVYGSNTQIPQLTVDKKGRVTSATALSLFTAQNTAVFTSSGTWTVPQGVTTILVSGCAAGGGGGGGGTTNSSGGSAVSGAGGGAGQSVIKKSISVIPGHSLSITIGAGGAGGAGGAAGGSNGATGGAGGNTVLYDSTSSTTLLTLTGGNGGGGGYANSGNLGAIGGSGYPKGGDSPDSTAQGGISGVGGSTPFGGGGTSSRASAAAAFAGSNGYGYGSGGAGGGAAYVNTSYVGGAGGAGAPGIIIIEW